MKKRLKKSIKKRSTY